MEFQISLMMFATWLEGLICPATTIHTAVAREKKEKALRFKLRKKRNYGIGLQLLSRWDQLIDNMSNNNDSTSICKDRKCYSILEVMSELHSIERVNIGDDFHGFATEFLGLRRNRECIHDVKHLRRRGIY
jgi:hypothetical protein